MRQVQKEKAVFFTTFVMIYISNISQVQAVDWKWGEWDSWSDCTETCGDGVQLRHRECNNPPSQNGRKPCDIVLLPDCNGNQYCEFKPCNQRKCAVRVKSGCKGAEIKGVEFCKFPFRYRNRVYEECTRHGTAKNQEWCGIEYDVDDWGDANEWCYCEGSVGDCERKNIARGKKTSQSSTSLGAGSELAVDGDTSSNFHSGTCTHTQNEKSPWWAVDLGELFYVQKVTIYNRDRYQIRLEHLEVHVYHGDPTSGPDKPTKDNLKRKGKLCKVFHNGRIDYFEAYCEYESRRVLLIIERETAPMTLCEVEVFGCKKKSGSWSPFSQWSACSATCGGGNQFRTRYCDNPPPKYGAATCPGVKVESSRCNENDCLELINECSSGPCGNHGSCTDQYNQYTCECIDGYIGNNCQIDADECDSAPCQNDGSCTDEINKYKCRCQDGFIGKNCETDVDDCEYQACENGGACVDHPNSFSCHCVSGYTGVKCETDINECESEPCQNNGRCIDGINAFYCQCADGYTADKCETNINECFSGPCLNNGSCIDGVGEYACMCPAESSGFNCEFVSIATKGKQDFSKDPPLGPKTLPLLIGGVVACVVCVIALVVAIVKYRRKKPSQKKAPDMNTLTTVTPSTPTTDKKKVRKK